MAALHLWTPSKRFVVGLTPGRMLPSVGRLVAACELQARMGVRGPGPNYPVACFDSTVESTGSSGPVSPTMVPKPFQNELTDKTGWPKSLIQLLSS